MIKSILTKCGVILPNKTSHKSRQDADQKRRNKNKCSCEEQ